MLCIIDFLCIFASLLFVGVLAHLARALDWQSKGGEFESRMLHITNPSVSGGVCAFLNFSCFRFWIKKTICATFGKRNLSKTNPEQL